MDSTIAQVAEQPKFSNPNEEITYLRERLEERELEFLEFQESSRELETEYEAQIKQLEAKLRTALDKVARFETDNEQLKSKYSVLLGDTQTKINDYQKQIGELKAVNERLSAYIRKLEQSNDDLERSQRALAASLQDFEGQLNKQIERNALLENEVSDKEELENLVQRLKEAI